MGVYPESFLAPMRADIAALDARLARAAPVGDALADARQEPSRAGSALMGFASLPLADRCPKNCCRSPA